ncbi:MULTISPECIES: hypothetical protein [Haloarcula]|uniref:hypothetical protein n=1 Tax=Haloarcula TaxID=2237 RepID=UPI0023ECB70F|nr:hypothetical protein [Halomicroarcula sp. XH51]
MRLDSIEIREFSQQDEYTAETHPEKEDVNGDSLLIKGTNRSGKTLTFNALRYAVLGETVGMSPGRGNEVEIGFTDGSRFFRGHPSAWYETRDNEFEAGEAQTQLREDTGPENILENYFLNSRIEMLPLENLSRPERLDLIRSVTDPEHQVLIERHSKAWDQLDWWISEEDDELRKVEESIDEVRSKIQSFESQERRMKTVVTMGESGQLEKIRRVLDEHQELEEELDDLFARKEGIRKQLDRLRNRRDYAESYRAEVNELIAEAVSDFVCPACKTSVTSRKAENRIDDNRCPFCARKKSTSELREELEEKQEDTEGVAEELQEEIDELKEEREEVQHEIERLKAEQPSLEDLDPNAKRKLDDHDGDIKAVVDEAVNALEEVREKLEHRREELEQLEEQRDVIEDRLEFLRESRRFAEERLSELEEDSYRAAVREFADAWTEVFQELSPEIGQQIWVSNEGEIFLPGSPADRPYNGDDLSDSERQLLNISFVITLQNFATDSGLAAVNTLVLDEPFNHLDRTSTSDLLGYLLEDENRQYVFTSSDENVWDVIPTSQIMELQRNTIQSKLTDFP